MGRGDESGRSGRWRTLLQVAVSAAAVALIARQVDLRESARVLAAAPPAYVAVAILLYLGGQVMSAVRWSMIGAAVGLDASVGRYVRVYLISMFFLFFGPSTLGGDVIRGLYLGEGGRWALAFNSVVFDRLNGLVVLIAIGAASFVLFPGYDLPAPLLWATAAFGGALFAGWWLAPWLARMLLPSEHGLRRFVLDDLGPFWRDRAMLVRASALSLVVHFMQLLTQYLVTRALGLAVPFSYICIFHPLVSALAALPITLSGIGLREGGYLWFLKRIGVEEASAVAFGGLWLLVVVANSLIGGLVFVASGARLPPVRDARR
jgi:uncharacterized membrane protein YbhN (UPF0104 family)